MPETGYGQGYRAALAEALRIAINESSATRIVERLRAHESTLWASAERPSVFGDWVHGTPPPVRAHGSTLGVSEQKAVPPESETPDYVPGGTPVLGRPRWLRHGTPALKFELGASEREVAQAFRAAHDASHGRVPATSGGRYTYQFTPTGIGTIVRLDCADCGTEIDLTDYEAF